MKIEFGRSGEDETNFNVTSKWGGCFANAEETNQEMSEIVVQVEDDHAPLSPDTLSSPEADLFLFAPVSDIEDCDNSDSDSSNVPPNKQHSKLSSILNVRSNKLDKCSEEKGAIPKADRKPRRKKKNDSTKQSNSSSSNSQSKHRGRKKSHLKMNTFDQSEPYKKMSVATASLVSAPYTKPETAISPRVAMEPPGFPSLQVKMEEPCLDDKNSVLLQVLKYCQSLSTAVQRLEQKIDGLQEDFSRLYHHIHKDNPKEQHSPLWKKEHPPTGKRGQIKTSTSTYAVLPVAASQRELAGNLKTYARSPKTLGPSQPNGNCTEADKAKESKTTGRRRGEGKSRGRSKRESQPADTQEGPPPPPPKKERARRARQTKRRADADCEEGPCASKVAKILSELQERRTAARSSVEESCEATKNTSATNSQVKQVMIGSAFRKVWIPYSVYMEAFKQDEPHKAVVPVLHAVFPRSVLTSSAVVGDPQRGIQELSPNKLEAVREWLAEMYPRHELEVKGKAWAECLGVLNTITKKLKMETTPTKNSPPKVPGI
ncbi:hypothetical protein ACEWY4_014199 [Coilia grayii]|uniref:BEN domain-containing protein n=1 Tax=Coilia grayii TaxID=363190 RepID=A0ABD1JRL0_9TELE